jgi:DNA invertase Pin-like site-specific DNA recombinase/DNA transposition AAA+ family ATPase
MVATAGQEARTTSTTSRGTPIVAASYERVSSRLQGRYGFSLGAQLQSLGDFTRSQGWLLPEHLRFRDGEDDDASGADWDLPDLNRMLAAARQNEFQVLVVPDFDRFARLLVKGLVLEEQLKKYGVRVVYQRVPLDDSPEGRLLKNQLFSFAEFEREKIALRTMMGRRRKAQTGMVMGVGPAPYGYRFTHVVLDNGRRRVSGLEHDPLTAPVARGILRSLRTRSTLDVMADLNSRGIPGPSGKDWNATTLYRMGLNPVYVGTWVYGKNGQRSTPENPVGIPVAVPALITREEWDDIARAFAHRNFARRGRQPVEADQWLLRGLLTCGHCRGAIRTANNHGVRYYRCGCHIPSIARHARKPLCDMPDFYATDLESEPKRILNETLLDADNLAAGLATARSQHDQADQMRRDRLAVLDDETTRQRKRLDNIACQFAEAGSGEVFAALMRQAQDIEALIDRFNRERADLGAVRADGLSGEEADAIEAFAAEVREGLVHATPADQRRLYQLLRVRGTVYLDPEGVRLGRYHTFRIEWDGAVRLLHSLNRNLSWAIEEVLQPEDPLRYRRRPGEWTELVFVDEADRLKLPALEELRDRYDRGRLGLVLIGMPGIEKRLARYAQFYSRVGFVHEFRPLAGEEVRFVLACQWQQLGLMYDPDDAADAAAMALAMQLTRGNFRLIERLFAQVDRILGINELRRVTTEVVEAAREGLVIGPPQST